MDFKQKYGVFSPSIIEGNSLEAHKYTHMLTITHRRDDVAYARRIIDQTQILKLIEFYRIQKKRLRNPTKKSIVGGSEKQLKKSMSTSFVRMNAFHFKNRHFSGVVGYEGVVAVATTAVFGFVLKGNVHHTYSQSQRGTRLKVYTVS